MQEPEVSRCFGMFKEQQKPQPNYIAKYVYDKIREYKLFCGMT